jgi:hypothetical protein
VLDRIAPAALPRSSIIVSDEPLSRETNYRTEFVAVLSNQPQGGFVTRRPTADVRVARGNVPGGNVWGGNAWPWGGNVRDNDRFGSPFQPNSGSQTDNTRRRGGQPYRQMQQGWR